MGEADLLARSTDHDLPNNVDNLIAHLQGKGLGGNIVRDLPTQLTPPVAAAWSGKQYRLTLCRSGLETWMELYQAMAVPVSQGVAGLPMRVPVGRPVRNRADFTSAVCRFLTLDGDIHGQTTRDGYR